MDDKTKIPFIMVDNDEKLSACCALAAEKTYIMLDTEFVRTRTFYAKLGLIQLFDGEQVSLIDPLTIQDFSPFVALLKNPKVLKVLHACSEDLEVLWHNFQQLPEPMIDTQVMAQFLGFGNSAGLAMLLKHYFQFEMDKGASRTNWLARPLTAEQLHYAAADVWYLWDLYEKLNTALDDYKAQAAQQESDWLVQNAKRAVDLDKLYLKIAGVQRLDEWALCRLQALAKWRYVEAQRRNLAVNFVVRGENLAKVARSSAKTPFDLLELGLPAHEVRIHGKKMLRIVEECKEESVDLPRPLLVHSLPDYKKWLTVLHHTLEQQAAEDMPLDLLVSKRLLEGMLKWYFLQDKDPNKLPRLLKTWRKPYGERLVARLDAGLAD